jgi:hypothetical protein
MTPVNDSGAATPNGPETNVVEIAPGRSSGAASEHPARQDRHKVVEIIAAAVELADHMEQEAELIVAQRLAQADEELAGRRRMMEQAEIDLERRRSLLADELKQLEEEAQNARALIANAEQNAAEVIARAESEAQELLERARDEVVARAESETQELLERARGEAEELLARARGEATALVAEARGEATDLVAQARGEASELVERARHDAAEEAPPEPETPEEQQAAWEPPPLSLEDLASGSLPRLSNR